MSGNPMQICLPQYMTLGMARCVLQQYPRGKASDEALSLHLQIALSSDEAVFGGWENVSKKYDVEYQTQEVDTDMFPRSILLNTLSCLTCPLSLYTLVTGSDRSVSVDFRDVCLNVVRPMERGQWLRGRNAAGVV